MIIGGYKWVNQLHMKRLSARLLIIAIGFGGLAACKSSRQTAASNVEELAGESLPTTSKTPPCILKMIDSTKKLEPSLQLTEITRYKYNGATVYLVGAPCCDQFNVVYDSACNYLFAPSGGFTGKGDRNNTDFFIVAKQDSVIWRKGK
jgi:hypothetical protein